MNQVKIFGECGRALEQFGLCGVEMINTPPQSSVGFIDIIFKDEIVKVLAFFGGRAEGWFNEGTSKGIECFFQLIRCCVEITKDTLILEY